MCLLPVYLNKSSHERRQSIAIARSSSMAALQFFLLGEADHADAWQRYLRLCRKGGTASYTELCAVAGLKTPFEAGSVAAIARPVAEWIAAHQV